MSLYPVHLFILFYDVFVSFFFGLAKNPLGKRNTPSLTETGQVVSRILHNYVKSKNLVNTYTSYKEQIG